MSRILIGLTAVWLFAGGFSPTTSSACSNEFLTQGGCKPCKRPDGTLNHSPNVTELILDRTQLRVKDLSAGAPPEDAGPSSDMMINVATNAEDAENDVLDYHYTISGGRIVGSGTSVQWDLNGVMPGTYTITAGVDDSCGICGKTITKAVMIIGKPVVAATPKPVSAVPPTSTKGANTASPSVITLASAKTATTSVKPASTTPSTRARSAGSSSTVSTSSQAKSSTAPAAAAASGSASCSCPKIIIADPEKTDTDLIFTTKIFDLTGMNRLSYIWTVTGGTVISQDGRSIRVKPGIVGGSVSVIVNGLDPKCSCPNKAQKTF